MKYGFDLARQWLAGFLLCFVSAAAASADLVDMQTGPGMTTQAEYRLGDASKPLILFIHGFLQTRDFSTVKRLADALADNGYSTLSPNLSLGISKRARSIPCESIHLHSLDNSAREIALWVEWARANGHDRIVVLGHRAPFWPWSRTFLLKKPS
jgi:pimeloyl-ACP methyl ester carboxylesterase